MTYFGDVVHSPEEEILLLYAYRFITGEKWNRFLLYSHINDFIPDAVINQFSCWNDMRKKGIPIQYLTQFQSFLSHEYEVELGVFIPRPETECLVIHALEAIKKIRKKELFGLEIGIGSGVISIELLHEFPQLRMWASDINGRALLKANNNAKEILKIPERLTCLHAVTPSSIWEPFELAGVVDSYKKVDFLVMNPPYLMKNQKEVEPNVMQYEPHEALFAPDSDPLFFYRRVAQELDRFIVPGGFVIVEVPHERSEQIIDLFLKTSFSSVIAYETSLFQDLSGRDRILQVQLAKRSERK